MKTVEPIIEETEWIPEPGKRAWNAIVGIRTEKTGRTLRRKVTAAGGKWNAVRKVWEIPYRTVLELGLQAINLRRDA